MRFYFDLRDDFYALRDTDGLDCPDLEIAKNEAIAAATSIAKDVFLANGSEVTLAVRDDEKVLLEITLTLKLHHLTSPRRAG